MKSVKLTKRTVDAISPAEKRFTVWDTELSGFGMRVTPGGDRVYVCKYRLAGRQRWATIGRHGSPWTPDEARREALRTLGDAAKGVDRAGLRQAARQALTFSDLCDLYLKEGVAHKRASTLRSDLGRIVHHLKPLLGGKAADKVNRGDIERLLTDVKNAKTAVPRKKLTKCAGSVPSGGAGVAAQCVALASTILGFAVDRGMRADNPARGVRKPPVRKLERFLTLSELSKLASALKDEETENGGRSPVTAIRLMALTGARRGEILNLRWDEVDLDRRTLNLKESKTGRKTVFLSEPAVTILSDLPRPDQGGFVFPGQIAGKPISAVDKCWHRVRLKAGLHDVRMHDLRHTFASHGASSGLGLPIVGKLLGHTQAATTQRYAHLADDPVRRAADAIGAGIAEAMGLI